MKITALIPVAVAVLLSSCVSPSEYRVKHNPEMYSKLSETEQQNARYGVVKQGMTKDAVFLAWGAPPRVTSSKHDGKTFERWHYPTYRPVYTGYGYYGGGFGFGYWGRHRGFAYYDPYIYGPSVSYVRTEGWWVEFVNGRVAAYNAPGESRE